MLAYASVTKKIFSQVREKLKSIANESFKSFSVKIKEEEEG